MNPKMLMLSVPQETCLFLALVLAEEGPVFLQEMHEESKKKTEYVVNQDKNLQKQDT